MCAVSCRNQRFHSVVGTCLPRAPSGSCCKNTVNGARTSSVNADGRFPRLPTRLRAALEQRRSRHAVAEPSLVTQECTVTNVGMGRRLERHYHRRSRFVRARSRRGHVTGCSVFRAWFSRNRSRATMLFDPRDGSFTFATSIASGLAFASRADPARDARLT